MATFWATLFIIGITVVKHGRCQDDNGAPARQLTGQEVFCLNLAESCPPNLLKGAVCASNAHNFENECAFWLANCDRKSTQRMSLVARTSCPDDYCPAHCRGEKKDFVCGSFVNEYDVVRHKTYRNYCKYRQAACKQKSIYGIILNLSYYGECGSPRTTTPGEVTGTPVMTEATTGSLEFQDTTIETVDTTLSPEEVIFYTEIIEGTDLLTEEIMGTQSPDDQTLSTDMTEEEFVTFYTEIIDGTMFPDATSITPGPEEIEGTLATDEFTWYTEIIDLERTLSTEETKSPEAFMEMEGTESPYEMITGFTEYFEGTTSLIEGTESAEEGTDSPDGFQGTTSLDGLEGTQSTQEMEGTEIPYTTDSTDLGGTTLALTDDRVEATRSPDEMDAVDLLRGCLTDNQLCLEGAQASDDVFEIINNFLLCSENFTTCLGDGVEGLEGEDTPDRQPESRPEEPVLGPSK